MLYGVISCLFEIILSPTWLSAVCNKFLALHCGHALSRQLAMRTQVINEVKRFLRVSLWACRWVVGLKVEVAVLGWQLTWRQGKRDMT